MARSHSLLLTVLALVPAPSLAQAPGRDTPSVAAAGSEATRGAPPAVAPQSADELADLKVKTLEERVNDLKEKVFRTKARLMNLQEMVVGGDVTSGARAVLFHRNEMGAEFRLESVTYTLDGAPIFTKVDREGDLHQRDQFEIFNGRVVPGNHQITVKMVYRGHGFGFFSYLDDYRFKVQSAYVFNAEPGKTTQVKVVGFEKGGITAELKDRPAVRYDVDVRSEDRSLPRPAAAPAGGGR